MSKWHEVNHQILAGLDIRATYVNDFGLDIEAKTPRQTGWLPCRAKGRTDKNPSAEINIGDGPARGRYRDFGDGSGQSISLFDFAAKFGPHADWRAARNHYAQQTKTKLPSGEEDPTAKDRIRVSSLTPGVLLMWTREKIGTSPEAVLRCGGLHGSWPAKSYTPQSLLSFPMFGPGLLDLDPTAYHCAPLAGRRIRKWRGKGNEPEMLRTMTIGSPGLMNTWGIKHLADAKVVWLVEGLSDMLAMQTALGDRTDHIVLSCGGASYHLREDMRPLFGGKDMRICFDNDEGIPSNPGQTGAAVQVTRLVGVAASVRNVVLPAGVKDVRDYLNAGHTYDELLAYSETFEPVAPEDKSAQLEPHEALLKTLGITVCGQIDGTPQVEIFSRDLHKTSVIRDINRWSYANALMDIGEPVEEHIEDGKDVKPPKSSLNKLRLAIAKEAGKRLLSSKPAVGCGIWMVGESLVLVGPRRADIYTPSGDLESVHEPVVGDQRIHFSGEPWYNPGELMRNIQQAADTGWCQEVLHEVTMFFREWDNWTRETTPELITGLVLASYVQTIWKFRPQLAFVGPSNSGKSYLFEEGIEPMLGPICKKLEKATEPGFRQSVGDTAKIMILDEFESSRDRENTMKLLRTSSRGGSIAKGSPGQKGPVEYGLKHIVFTAAIDIDFKRQADRNRFLIFELKKLPKGRPAQIQVPPLPKLQEWGRYLLAIALRYARSALDLVEDLRTTDTGREVRDTEMFAPQVAMLSKAQGFSLSEARGYLVATMHDQVPHQKETDEERLLNDIMEGTIQIARGRRATVANVLWGDEVYEDAAGSAVAQKSILSQVGIKVIDAGDGDVAEESLFFASELCKKELLSKSTFKDSDIGQILRNLDGARRDRRRLGVYQARGVLVPVSTLQDLVGYERRNKQQEF